MNLNILCPIPENRRNADDMGTPSAAALRFYDKHNNEIRVGDILRYQETANDAEDYGKSLDEVVMHNGKLCGIQRVGFPRWTDLRDVIKEPIGLRHYASFGTNRVMCAEIIGNVREHPERMTPEHARRVFPANGASET